MRLESDDVVRAEYYNNLFLAATKLLDRHINEPFIIASNCISLIAGLTFHLLKNYHYNYRVNYYSKNLIVNSQEEKQFIIVNQADLEKLDNVTLYFYYEGQEPGILCVD